MSRHLTPQWKIDIVLAFYQIRISMVESGQMTPESLRTFTAELEDECVKNGFSLSTFHRRTIRERREILDRRMLDERRAGPDMRAHPRGDDDRRQNQDRRGQQDRRKTI